MNTGRVCQKQGHLRQRLREKGLWSQTDLDLNFRSATYLLDDFCALFNFSVKMERIYFAWLFWELNEISHGSVTSDVKETLSKCQQAPMFHFYSLPNLRAFCTSLLEAFS